MILRDDLPADGNGNNAPAVPPAPVAPPVAAPPPSAVVITTGERSEREVDLEKELEILRADLQVAQTEKGTLASTKTKLETDIAHLQNQLADLKKIPAPPEPAPGKAHWLKEFGF